MGVTRKKATTGRREPAAAKSEAKSTVRRKSARDAAPEARAKAAGRKGASVTSTSKASKAKTSAAARGKAEEAPAPRAVAAKPGRAKATKVAKAPRPAATAGQRVKTAKDATARPPRDRKRKPPRRPSKTEWEAFRRLLLQKHASLVAAYNSAKVDSRTPTLDGTEDYIDYAVSSYDRDFNLSLTEMERRQLTLVEEALRRIDRGEYGKCLNCGNPIPPKRLEVEPWARHCVRCQELEDRGLLDLRLAEGDDDEFGAPADDSDDADDSDLGFKDDLEYDDSDDDDERPGGGRGDGDEDGDDD